MGKLCPKFFSKKNNGSLLFSFTADFSVIACLPQNKKAYKYFPYHGRPGKLALSEWLMVMSLVPHQLSVVTENRRILLDFLKNV